MTLSVKFFTIVSALLAVVVNGSSVGFAEGGLQARSTLGNVMYITVIPGDSRIVPADDRVCYNLDATAISFRVVDLAFDCVGYPDLGCSDIDTAEVLVGKEPGLDWEGRINSYLCMASL